MSHTDRLRPMHPPMSQRAKAALQEKFYFAVYTAHLDQVRKCLQRGADPNIIHEWPAPMTALNLAAERGDVPLGLTLVNFLSTDIECRSIHGYTPLMQAVFFQRLAFMRMLLENGANVNVRDQLGKTPLHVACRRGNLHLIDGLIRSGAVVNVMDCFENTPVSICSIEAPNKLALNFLFRHGANFDLEDRRSLHVFFELILNCNIDIQIHFVMIFLRAGLEVNVRDKLSGRICLHFVAITGFLRLGIYLVEYGADRDAVDVTGRTPAMVAKDHDNLALHDYFRKGYLPPNILKVLPILKLWRKKVQEKRKRLEVSQASDHTSESRHHLKIISLD